VRRGWGDPNRQLSEMGISITLSLKKGVKRPALSMCDFCPLFESSLAVETWGWFLGEVRLHFLRGLVDDEEKLS